MVHFSCNSYNLTISQFLNFLQFLVYEVVFLYHLRNSTGPGSIFGSVSLFFENFFFTEGSHLQFFDIFGQNGFWKIPNGPPFQFFSALWDFFRKKTIKGSPIHEYFDILKSFWYFWALDMAPTWAYPGLLAVTCSSVNAVRLRAAIQ